MVDVYFFLRAEAKKRMTQAAKEHANESEASPHAVCGSSHQRPTAFRERTTARSHPRPLAPLAPSLESGAIKPMITMYTMANIDSALWGTRSVGDVKCTTSGADTDSDSDTGYSDEAEAVPPRRVNVGGDDGIMMRDFELSCGDTPAAPGAPHGNVEEEVPHRDPDSDDAAVGISGGGGRGREAGELGTDGRSGRKGKEGGGKKSGIRLSLFAWKFIILVPWVLVNVGVTVGYLRWRLYTLALVGFFSQIAGMVFFIVAAWVEMRLQRRSTLPPSLPPRLAADNAQGPQVLRNIEH